MKKFLCQPVSPFVVNQYFGENKACVDLATGKKVITCDGFNPPEGYKSLYATSHTGVDLRSYHGQPIYCAADGFVEFIDTQERSGLDVRIVSPCDGIKYRHIYEHLLGYQPKIGDTIKTGDLVGWADNTGFSAGSHLHFQLEQWIDNKWVSVDPMIYMDTLYALTSKGIQSKLAFIKEKIAVLADLVADYLRNK